MGEEVSRFGFVAFVQGTEAQVRSLTGRMRRTVSTWWSRLSMAFDMASFTGGTGGGVTERDLLQGANPHVALALKARGKWRAWCTCKPGRVSEGRDAASAVARVSVTHGVLALSTHLYLTLSKDPEFGWQAKCHVSNGTPGAAPANRRRTRP